MALVMCYNKGCGQKFDPTINESGACTYHPGVPVFHDALKGWSCCKKRSTDFTQFLNFPGCTSGPHSNEKPKEPEKQTATIDEDLLKQSEAPKVVFQTERSPIDEPQRPSADEPLEKLKVVIVASLQKALEKHLQNLGLESKNAEKEENGVPVGTNCQNMGCKSTYKSQETDQETCTYHPGVAIFHEGMKYWSCCQRKTSDFTNFLDQAGCETGKHSWTKKEEKTCRQDWFQTSQDVNISVFAKLPVPDQSYVEVNKVVCHIHVVFEGGKHIYDKFITLRNPINPEKSTVKLMGTKVEIVLKKAEMFSWPTLDLKTEPEQEADADNS